VIALGVVIIGMRTAIWAVWWTLRKYQHVGPADSCFSGTRLLPLLTKNQ